MNQTLDLSQENFKELLDQSTELVLQQFKGIDRLEGYHDFPQKEVEEWFNEPLPIHGMEHSSLLNEVEEKF